MTALRTGRWYSVHFVVAEMLTKFTRVGKVGAMDKALLRWGAVTQHPRSPDTVQIVPEFWDIVIREMGIADAIVRLGGDVDD